MTEAAALDVMEALAAGESFADLARAVSIDTGSGNRGGELDWSPVTNFVGPFADAVVEAELGTIVGPVESEFGFHVIQVRAREERELSEFDLENARNQRFDNWFEEHRANVEERIEMLD